jgi:putative endonuclease
MFFTYILVNKEGVYYKGSTSDYKKRLQEHNEGLNTFTRGRGPWKLIFVQSFETRQEALICEKKLKRCNKDYLNWLIDQPVNILDR